VRHRTDRVGFLGYVPPTYIEARPVDCGALSDEPPTIPEHIMNKDQVKGRIKETKGKVKEATGKAVGSKKLEAEGKLEAIVGDAQGEYGDLKSDIKQATKSKKP
jgi:uncharacterized protein YjbJ (UPF0337 family)